jgi:hypothetical protein
MAGERTNEGWRITLKARGRYASLFLPWLEDRIEVSSGRLVVTHLRGLFRTSRRFERDAIRRILLAGRDDRLALETGRRRVELSRLGTRAERFMAAAALRVALGFPEPQAEATAIPRGWEIVTLEGERVLVPGIARRRIQALLACAGTLALGVVTFALGRHSGHDHESMEAALILLAATLGLAAWTAWLALGRPEWRIHRGRLTLRMRFLGTVREVFEARRLGLVMTTDSDGDEWYELVALTEDGSPLPTGIEVVTRFVGSPPRPAGITLHTSRATRRTVARRMNDGSAVRDLGVWLAHATGLEFQDHTAPTVIEFPGLLAARSGGWTGGGRTPRRLR